MPNPTAARTRTPSRKQSPRRDRSGLRVVPAGRRAQGADTPTVDENVRRFVQCRSLGHEWRHAGREAGYDGMPCFLSICGECTTERRVFVPTTGANVVRRYKYPDGYARRGEDRLTSVQWRRVLIVSLGS